MTDEPRTRTPRLESVLKAIDAGAYDDGIKSIYEAVMGRKTVLQEKVLESVRDVFGEDYGVSRAAPEQKPNVFVERFKEQARNQGGGPIEEVRTPDGAPMDPEAEERLRAESADSEDLGPDHESRSPIFGPPPE
jgi:hypothetical protein